MPKIASPTWENPKWKFPRHYTPLSRESFDYFKRTKKGDTSTAPIYEAIGLAVTQWSMVDSALCRMYSRFVVPGPLAGAPQVSAVEASLGVVTNINSKIEIIREAAHAIPTAGSFKRRVKGHLDIVIRAAARRNEIAHGVIFNQAGYGYSLVPALSNMKKINKNPNYHEFEGAESTLGPLWKFQFRSRDIRRYAERFTLLYCETQNLAVDVENEMKSLPHTQA